MGTAVSLSPSPLDVRHPAIGTRIAVEVFGTVRLSLARLRIISEVKNLNSKRPSQTNLQFERRWGDPLLEFARWLAGTGFWISHLVIVTALAALVVLIWFDVTVHQTAPTMETMTFGLASLFGFAGWIARCKR